MRTTIAFLLLTQPLLAADVYHPTIHTKNGITAYEAVLSTKLPESVYKLTPEQWYNAANARNLMALKARREAAHKQDGHTRYARVTESGGWSQTRFGGGVGAGGFGGSGGYAGYLGAGDQSSGGGGMGGFQYGAGRPGNSMQSKGASSSMSYTMEYKDWPVFNGGDVELLNPWVMPRRPK